MPTHAEDEVFTVNGELVQDYMYEPLMRWLQRFRLPRGKSPDWPRPNQVFRFHEASCGMPVMQDAFDGYWGIFVDEEGKDQMQRVFYDHYNSRFVNLEEATEELVELAKEMASGREYASEEMEMLAFYRDLIIGLSEEDPHVSILAWAKVHGHVE